MTNVVYGLTEEKYTFGSHMRTSCGIAAYADPDIDGTATIVASVYDITSDKEKLSKFVQTCNYSGLLPQHLNDAVEDFLAD